MSACKICLDINWELEVGKYKWTLHVAPEMTVEYHLHFESSMLKESVSSGCVICRIIMRGLQIMIKSVLKLDVPELYEGELVFHRTFPLELQLDHPKIGTPIRFQYYTLAKGQPRYWPIIDTACDVPSDISSRSCVATICDSKHRACSTARLSASFIPSRILDLNAPVFPSIVLMDTRDQTFDQTTAKLKYGTLSHCWGLVHVITTRKETLMSHKERIEWSNLPKTFQDAIEIFRELRVRYIWIDSLCIVQNDTDDWEKEAVLMADIYTNSYLNIAATAAKDSTAGCFNDREIKYFFGGVSISSFQIPHDGHDISKVFVRPSFEPIHRRFTTSGKRRYNHPAASDHDALPLLTRAWVYQERMLASRTLHFHPSEMILECRSGLFCECAGLEKIYPLLDYNINQDIFSISESAVLDRWLNIVGEYCKLALTKHDDRAIAILGVANIFQRRLGSKYLADIARALLWDASLQSGRIVYRFDRPTAPSWSWISLIMFPVGTAAFYGRPTFTSFQVHEYFRYEGTEMSGVTNDSRTALKLGSIRVRATYISATLIHSHRNRGPGRSGLFETSLLVEEMLDDFVLIMWSSMDLDVSEDQEWCVENFSTVECLFVGTMSVVDADSVDESETPVVCALVCKQPDSKCDGYQRVGLSNL
ncbi:hypothetical protein EAE99_004149 [Botrytis elliptica]|nr:hypothetical protein EAE99_004149 [Botrytis elliptica]